MTYEKLTNFIYYIRAMQESELDTLCLITSPKGFGKSTTSIQISREYIKQFGLTCCDCHKEWIFTGKAIINDNYQNGMSIKKDFHEPCPHCHSNNIKRTPEINFQLYLAYDNEEVEEKIFELQPYSPIIPDEGVRFMMAEDWNVSENKRMKKLFAQMRTKKFLVFANIPKFSWVDRKYRNDMATFWVRILKRGIALLMQPDLGENDDPWHMKTFIDILGSYFYFTPESVLLQRAQKLLDKHQCVFDYFKIPKLPNEIYAKYQIARDAKVFERKHRELVLDQKEISKIVAYNLMEKWQEIQGAIKAGRFDRPTLKILESIVFSNPVTDEVIVRYTTLRNWINDIKKIAKKKLPGN